MRKAYSVEEKTDHFEKQLNLKLTCISKEDEIEDVIKYVSKVYEQTFKDE